MIPFSLLSRSDSLNLKNFLCGSKPIKLDHAKQVLCLSRLPRLDPDADDTSIRFCDIAREMPSQRVDQLMAIIAKTPEVDHAFRELCKNYANYGTKTGDWLEADDGKQFLEVAGPNMPGPGQQIMFRRDGVRIVESTTDTPKRYVSSWLTFDEYELVHGEHPSEIFIRNWKAEINAYLRWQRLAVRDVTMQDFNVCYQTTEGGVSNESVTAVDELAVRLWLDRYHMRRVQIEPITVPATVTE